MSMEHWWNEIDRGNPKYQAQRDFVHHKSNTDLHGEGPETNRAGHDAAVWDRGMCLRILRTVPTQNFQKSPETLNLFDDTLSNLPFLEPCMVI